MHKSLLVRMLSLCALMVAGALFADQPADVPVMGGGLIQTLQTWASSLAAPEWLITIAFFVIEFIGRTWKTAKPWSILYMLRDLLVAVAMVLNGGSAVLDRVLQRTKDSNTVNLPPKV